MTIFLALLGFFPSYHLYYINKQKKEFNITLKDITYHDSISSNNNKINITKPISVLQLEIENTGNQPLQVSDFSTDLTINTGKDEILDYKIVSSYPSNMHLNFERVFKNQIRLNSKLFNKGEKFSLQIITKNRTDSLFVDCRVVGVEK